MAEPYGRLFDFNGLGMLRFTLLGAGLLSLAGLAEASAADISAPTYTKAPMAAPVMPYNWTGCHVGANLGGVVSEDTRIFEFGAGGFVGGGQVGCDYQFASGWVVGAEGRTDWSSLRTSRAERVIFVGGPTVPAQLNVRNEYLASTTARLGYTFSDRWLLFVRGGAAWTNEKTDFAFVDPAGIPNDPRATLNRSGWTVGAGVEYAFAPQWSTSFEYNYYDFGTSSPTLFDPVTLATLPSFTMKDTIHAVTVGVNYHF